MARKRGWPVLSKRAAQYMADGRVNHWLHVIEWYGPSKGIAIEVGCAPGVLLAELQTRGYQCIGVEVDEAVADWIRTHMKLEIRTGMFPDSVLSLPSCDLFLAFDVLEHVLKPEEFMQKVASMLKPGGVAIVQTPIDRYDCEPPLGNDVPVVFDDIDHMFIFVDEAMRKLGAQCGLELISLNDQPWHIGHELCVYRKP